MTYPSTIFLDRLGEENTMKAGDLVVYSDQETMPQWANNYGIIVESSHDDDNRLCAVWWHGDKSPTIHYKYELKIITNKGFEYGKHILGRSKSSKRGSS